MAGGGGGRTSERLYRRERIRQRGGGEVGAHQCLVGVGDVDGGGLGVGGLALGIRLGEHGGEGGAKGAEGLVCGVGRAGLGGHGDVVHTGREAGGQTTPVGVKGLAEAGEAQTAVPASEASDVGPATLAHELGRGEGCARGQHGHDGSGRGSARLGRLVSAQHDGASGRGGEGGQHTAVQPGAAALHVGRACALRKQSGKRGQNNNQLAPATTACKYRLNIAPAVRARAGGPHACRGAACAAASAFRHCPATKPGRRTQRRAGPGGELADSSSLPLRPRMSNLQLEVRRKSCCAPRRRAFHVPQRGSWIALSIHTGGPSARGTLAAGGGPRSGITQRPETRSRPLREPTRGQSRSVAP